MNEKSVRHTLTKNDALRISESGRESVEPLGIYVSPGDMMLYCSLMAQPFQQNLVDVVISPDRRSFALAFGTAIHLMMGPNRKVDATVAYEMANHHFTIPLFAHPLLRDRRVLIVDDVVVPHDNRIDGMIEAVAQVQGKIVGVAAVCGHQDCFDRIDGTMKCIAGTLVRNLLLPISLYQEAKAA